MLDVLVLNGQAVDVDVQALKEEEVRMGIQGTHSSGSRALQWVVTEVWKWRR